MKKSLLALAVLGAFAGAASAQTNVTIYGVADVGIARSDTSATSATWSMDAGNQSGNRLGFKGSEDLGGGLKAIFTLENGFNIDNGTLGQGGRIFGRQAFVGLEGGFGAVKFGRQYTPLFLALDSVDPFGTGLAGAINNVFTGGGNSDIRMSNTVNYSLSAGGFSGQAAYGFGEVAGKNSGNRELGLGLGYANGPVNVQFAYHDTNNAANTDDATTTMLGGSFDFRVVKVHAAYAVNKGLGTLDTRDAMLGVSAPVGAAGTIMASYIRQNDRTAANADLSQTAIGYTHSLSKRTNLYTSYGRTNRDVGADSNLFNVGIRHKF